jgi:hypothetical protein
MADRGDQSRPEEKWDDTQETPVKRDAKSGTPHIVSFETPYEPTVPLRAEFSQSDLEEASTNPSSNITLHARSTTTLTDDVNQIDNADGVEAADILTREGTIPTDLSLSPRLDTVDTALSDRASSQAFDIGDDITNVGTGVPQDGDSQQEKLPWYIGSSEGTIIEVSSASSSNSADHFEIRDIAVYLKNDVVTFGAQCDTASALNIIPETVAARLIDLKDLDDSKKPLAQGLSDKPCPTMGRFNLTFSINGKDMQSRDGPYNAWFHVVADRYFAIRQDALLCEKLVKKLGLLLEPEPRPNPTGIVAQADVTSSYQDVIINPGAATGSSRSASFK